MRAFIIILAIGVGLLALLLVVIRWARRRRCQTPTRQGDSDPNAAPFAIGDTSGSQAFGPAWSGEGGASGGAGAQASWDAPATDSSASSSDGGGGDGGGGGGSD